MQTLLKTKIGPFLVISSVLAVWTLLAAGPGMAHQKGGIALLSPSCSTIPDDLSVAPADAFFTGTNVAAISAGTTAPTGLMTKRGVGSTNQRRGDQRFHYAKITIPTLAAGELRVFDSTAAGGATLPNSTTPSDAILCRKGSQIASSRESYASAHYNAERAASAAQDAAAKAMTFADTDPTTTAADALTARHDAAGTTPTQAETDRAAATDANTDVTATRNALTAARSALTAVANALTAVARIALTDADRTRLTGNASDASDAADALTEALGAENLTTASSTATTAKTTAVSTAKGVLGGTNGDDALTAAADALITEANKAHLGFRIRAPVSPGDEEYVVVVALPNTAVSPMPAIATSTALGLNVAFHGAIDSDDPADQGITGRLNPRAVDPYRITVTAPGLLTLGTTGSTDTIGSLENDEATPEPVAYAESGGSGDNFQTSVPVIADNYTIKVEGQTLQTGGAYTLDMDFKVAMSTFSTLTATGAENTPFVWSTNPVVADDATVQIKQVNEGSADEDYFLITVGTNSGRLTVQANDAATARETDADTSGTLFGPLGTGPMMEMKAGQIATDSDSGPSNHFKFTVPVEGGSNYLVKVTGTDGVYKLEFAFAAVAHTTTTVPPIGTIAPEATTTLPADGRHLYLFNVPTSGALYLHTTGRTNVVGTLYGPDGNEIAMDSNSGGDGDNFRIAANIEAGLYLLEVTGVDKVETGNYGLVSNFVAGDVVTTPTTPTTPGTGNEVATLQARVAELEDLLDACEEGVETDETGALENPPDGGYRSGIGLISGWVCAANEVTVEISSGGVVQRTLEVAYGTSRPDVPLDPDANCDNANAGFGMTYNFNHLDEGTYTIRAEADGELIGAERTFEVVHITGFARSDMDRFLRDLVGTCDVEDFPENGDAVRLLWEESTQNFVIEDAG